MSQDIKNQISLPIVYFPGWKVKVNNLPVDAGPGGKMGLITLTLPAGESQVTANFTDTPVRTIGNIISLLALLISPVWLLKRFTG